MITTRRLLATCSIVGLFLVASACGGDARPTWEVWDLTWATAQSAVPSASALVESGEDGLCAAGLAQLRGIREELIPTPEPVLDESVSEWLEAAEAAFFACPPIGDDDYSAFFGELDQLEGAIVSIIAGR